MKVGGFKVMEMYFLEETCYLVVVFGNLKLEKRNF
jgi:hypothetical protein